MGRRADVVVVGGGITGVATLRALARSGVEAVLLEHIDVLFNRQVTIGHPRASDVADGPSELGEIERWAAKLVRRVSTFVAKECCRGCRGEVLARGRRDPAVSSSAQNLPTGEVFAQMVCVALRIQAIAQQSELHAALAERDLAGQLISGERVGSDVGLEHARVQDAGHPDRFRRVDDIGVVDDALARLATRHQQKPVHTGQRRAHAVRFGIVRLAHLYATRGEVGNCGSGAHDGDDAALEDVSAVPSKLPQRTDWIVTFADRSRSLPRGDLRLSARIVGDEITDLRRFVFIPEDWLRTQRNAQTIASIVQGGGILFGAVLVIGGTQDAGARFGRYARARSKCA